MLLLLKYDGDLQTVKSSANCDAHLAESIFQTRSDICNIFYSRGMYEFPAKSGGKVMRRENEKPYTSWIWNVCERSKGNRKKMAGVWSSRKKEDSP